MKRIQEIYKDVCGYEGVYQVSNLGNVKSLSRNVANQSNKKSFRTVPEKVLSPKTKDNGYLEVNLSGRSKYVHRLVAEAFIGKIQGKQINHKDLNKKNNCVENLEVVTASENQIHAYKNGANKPPIMKGEKHPLAKLDNETVLRIRSLYSISRSISDLVTWYPSIPKSTLLKIVYRATWKHI